MALSVSRFENALNRGLLSSFIERLTFGTGQAIPFDDVQAVLGFSTHRKLGRQMVDINRIVGSEGRAHQFSRTFWPRSYAVKQRWASIYRAVESLSALPPVQLYEIGGYFFVRDGNHRVSVARAEKLRQIEAEVVSVDFPGTLEGSRSLKEIISRIREVQREDFYRKTGFPRKLDRPWFTFTFNLAYEKCYHLMLESGMEAAKWFEELYLPAWNLVNDRNLVKGFSGRSVGDITLLFLSFIKAAENKELAARTFLATAGKRKWRSKLKR